MYMYMIYAYIYIYMNKRVSIDYSLMQLIGCGIETFEDIREVYVVEDRDWK